MIATPPHTLFACPQCWAAVNEPGGVEPDGLCWAGIQLYIATNHAAGVGMATGDWSRYDAAHEAYQAHVVGALTGSDTRCMLASIEDAATGGDAETSTARLGATPGISRSEP